MWLNKRGVANEIFSKTFVDIYIWEFCTKHSTYKHEQWTSTLLL